MVRNKSTRVKATPMFVQDGHIRSKFAGFTHTRGANGGESVWHGTLQPSVGSPAYTVDVRYRVGSIPRVWVRSPLLRENAPHRYPDGHLCLYTPWEWNWLDSDLIAETLLPWAALWLYYYELWVDTGKWLGPETAHGDKKE